MAVTFISNGYDTTSTNPYTESAWAEAHPAIGLARYQVRSSLDWKVTAVAGLDRTVSINAGRGAGHGVTDKTVENETIQLDTIASGSRWDLIACRRDWTPTAGESKFMKINGGATPVIPGGRVVGPGNIDDQPLALVQVTAGQTQPTAIIDLRTWAGDGGGLIANDDLVRSFLNSAGTRIFITSTGIDWIRKVGANDTPEWISHDTTESAADVSTFGPGFSAVTSNWHKPRVRRSGNIVLLFGAVKRSGGDFGNMLTVPSGFRPTNGQTMFIGAGVSSNGIGYELAISNGVVSIINGYATESDTGASTVFPITASWSIT